MVGLDGFEDKPPVEVPGYRTAIHCRGRFPSDVLAGRQRCSERPLYNRECFSR